ncbi:MAG TPA: V-type ATP synthase subunit E [Candidatus Gracilibacteria bacterium]
MSLQDILKEILSQAHTEVEGVKKSLEAEKNQLKKAADADLSQAVDQVKARGKEAAISVQTKMEDMARKENKKVELQTRRAVIDKALLALIDHFGSLSEDHYADFFKKASSDLGSEKGVFSVPENRKSVAEKNAPSGCEVRFDKNVKSGFVFTSERFTVDNTFENLVMSEFRSPLEIYFTQKLNLA